MPSRIRTWLWRILLGLVVAVAAFALFAYVASERILNRHYPVAAAQLVVPADGASVERGEHIVRAVGACTLCHGEDFGGSTYADMGPVGRVVGPNLTRGRGGRGDFTDADWVRAIRFGVRRDGTSLVMMPSEVFTNFNNADLMSIVAFLRTVPPVDREMPLTRFGALGRALIAVGQLKILAAPKTVHRPETERAGSTDDVARGRYLAEVSGCLGCHGPGLSGGPVAGPPGLPPAANLTPAGLGSWQEADFVRAIRAGVRPDGSAINPFMPWASYATMRDDELHALWAYLRSVPPKPSGQK